MSRPGRIWREAGLAKEIERKFLVKPEVWPRDVPGTPMRQGYLCTAKERTVRVRLAGDRAWLTIKGVSAGATRDEYEYAIPAADAGDMLDRLCERPLIEKTRYRIPQDGLVWEVDVFTGDNAGLVLAEVELRDETQSVPLPPWIGAEVTHDPRYFNANLVRHPFRDWQQTRAGAPEPGAPGADQAGGS